MGTPVVCLCVCVLAWPFDFAHTARSHALFLWLFGVDGL